MSSACRCAAIQSLEGDDGIAYARDHLRLVAVADDGWSARWSCPTTGWDWLETYAPAWRPGGPDEWLERQEPSLVDRPAASVDRPRRRRRTAPWSLAAVSATVLSALLIDIP